VIAAAYNADCEMGDDGGVVEGEAAHILAPYLTLDGAKAARDTTTSGVRRGTHSR
jgi:hypothetical protein